MELIYTEWTRYMYLNTMGYHWCASCMLQLIVQLCTMLRFTLCISALGKHVVHSEKHLHTPKIECSIVVVTTCFALGK